MYRINICIFLILIVGQEFVFSQQLEGLRTIISGDYSVAQKQDLIDSIRLSIHPEDTMLRADFIHDVGVRWYYRELWKTTDDEQYLDSTIQAFQKATHLKQSVSQIDTASLVKSLYNLGFFSSLKAEYIVAIDTYRQIIALGQTDRQMANAYRESGKLLGRIGDYYNALEMFEKMVRLGHALQRNATISEAYYGVITTYAALDPIVYQDSIQKNLKRAERWITDSQLELPYMLKNAKANQLTTLGQYPAAIEIYQNLLDIPNEAHLAQVHNNLGYIYVSLDSLSLADFHLRESIRLNNQFSFAYENLADARLAAGEFEQALVFYDSAIYLSARAVKKRADFSSSSSAYLNALNYITSKAMALLTMYEREKTEHYLQNALTTFYQADSLVDVIRFQCTEDQSKFFWRKQAADLYVNAVKTCKLLEQPERAYYFMEKNKAILLLEELSNEQARQMAKLPRSLIIREIQLKKRIYELQAQDANHQGKVEQAKMNYHALIDSLVEAYPTYGKLKREIDILPYEEFKKLYASGNNQVIHFLAGDTLSYGLLTTASGSDLYRIPNDYRVLVDTVIQLQQMPITTKVQADLYAQYSATLLSSLIPDQYRSDTLSQLLLLPDGVLHRLAFEGLCTNPNSLDHFLIESHKIHYSQSVSWLDAVASRKRNTAKNMVAFAPVNFPSLPDLPETEDEVRYVSDLLDGNYFLKSAATKRQFQDQLKDHKIVHLATHANAPANGEPWIAFHDSTLTLTETYALPNRAELVVLGACNTSIGTIQAGEGMISMTRGFFYSGTNSVISTLWTINDETTRKLLMDFYEILNTGENKSDALHQAKINFLNSADGSLRSPYYWASLVLVGSDQPISNSFSWPWIILGLLSLLLISLLISRRYQRA